MKKRLFYMTAVVIMTVTFAACTADITTIPMGVMLDYSSVMMVPGETFTLKANVMPDEAGIKTLTWISTDTSVATVTDGVVTAIAEGEAIINVITNSGQKSAFCRLTIAYPVASITLDQTVSILALGKSTILTATVLPENAPDKSVKWESSDPDVAEVNEGGAVIAKAPGTAVIAAITEVGYRIATCTVKVPSENHIAMTWQPYEATSIFMMGNGTVEIDWGDGTTNETVTLSTVGAYFLHSYSNISPCAVIINCNNNITRLDCPNKRLTSLYVSANTSLTSLDCTGNQLTSLDLRNSTELTTLNCGNNLLLSSLNVSNTKLRSLNASNFSLTNLDVSNNVVLTNINCSNNKLTSLDVSSNSVLSELNCSNNKLTSLDVRNNTELTTLNCGNNPLSSFNVSNIKLRSLNVSNSSLTSLNVSSNPALTELNCNNNQLSTGALNDLFGTLHGNTITGGKTVRILGNPGTFTCNQNIATGKGWEVLIGNYVTMTLQPYGSVTIGVFGNGTVVIDWGDGSTENYSLQSNWGYDYYHYYSDNHPYTATIVGDITNLTVNYFYLTSLDVSNNTVLTNLWCIGNQLTSLDVSNNARLSSLGCSNNQLTSLDVSNNAMLSNLGCSNNQLTSLDVGNIPALVSLDCTSNQLSAEGLNALFRTLHSNNINYGYKWIYIDNNPGTSTCDQNIATDKGWTLVFNR